MENLSEPLKNCGGEDVKSEDSYDNPILTVSGMHYQSDRDHLKTIIQYINPFITTMNRSFFEKWKILDNILLTRTFLKNSKRIVNRKQTYYFFWDIFLLYAKVLLLFQVLSPGLDIGACPIAPGK